MLSCTIKRLSQGPTSRTGTIPANHQRPATAKCPRCSTATTAIALATAAETAIKGVAPLIKIVRTPSNKQIINIAQLCSSTIALANTAAAQDGADFVAQNTWLTPTTTRTRNQIPEPQRQAVRLLANTMLLQPNTAPGDVGGIGKPQVDNELARITLESRVTGSRTRPRTRRTTGWHPHTRQSFLPGVRALRSNRHRTSHYQMPMLPTTTAKGKTATVHPCQLCMYHTMAAREEQHRQKNRGKV
jgi:hypothetical protein